MAKAIQILFRLLFFITPLLFVPFTSELFEFNKTVFLYFITISIVALWVSLMLLTKRFIFRKSILDIPLLVFLLSQILATIFSIDIHTSIFGYYSRFNGSLLSTFCYALLYWSYVTFVDKKENEKNIRILLVSASIVSVYGILEHFGYSLSCLIIQGQLNTECWIQDVQNRVFATFGQPNWLGAYLVSLIPLSWYMILRNKNKKLIYYIVPSLLFLALLFTKSRSGFLAFEIAFIFYWIFVLIQKKHIKKFLVLSVVFLFLFLGTQEKQTNNNQSQNEAVQSEGGTESGEIRLIVWSGALQLIKQYPIFGTGVETFAYSYYKYRPIEHNYTSEWDHVYNKAHNEFLNIGANSGLVGLISYLILICIAIVTMIKVKNFHFRIALLTSFITLLITNFFGFSVGVTSLLFFLLPAIGVANSSENKLLKYRNSNRILIPLMLATGVFYFAIIRYWYADVLFAAGKSKVYETPEEATVLLNKAIELNSLETTYWNELSIAFSQLGDAQNAIQNSDKAFSLSPFNTTILKSRNNVFTDLAIEDPDYLHKSIETLTILKELAPTDPAVYHQIGLTYANLGDYPTAISYLEDAIRLKPNYKNARMAASLIALELQDYITARNHLEYILHFIAPDDEFAQKQLQKIEQQEKRP